MGLRRLGLTHQANGLAQNELIGRSGMILLTSLSVRRKNLLQQIGFRANVDFVQRDMPVNFDYHGSKQKLSLDEVTEMSVRAARLKVLKAVTEARALTILGLVPEETVVIGADTVVCLNCRVLDRPLLIDPKLALPALIKQAEDRARQMLTELRGQDFFVITGLVIAQGDNLENERSCYVVTEARMKQFSNHDMDCYIRTGEPLDKAGGFGIQERGVVLFDKIKGSYSNVVGLPLVEFVELLHAPLFEGRVQFRLDTTDTRESALVVEGAPELKVVSVGDINYDLAFNKFPAGFFSGLHSPGEHVRGELYRGIGGTAAIFALRAREAGFKQCSVLGVIGGDALGRSIEEDLHQRRIRTLLPVDFERRTSIALVFRDEAKNDTTLTLTDAHQALSEDDVNKARSAIEGAHVLFVSGYCLTDPNRQKAALKAMEWAKEANRLVVLDVTVDMDKAFDFTTFINMTQDKVDVLVAEIPTILAWLDEKDHKQDDWDLISKHIIPSLHQFFPTLFLRTSNYSHEIIASPFDVSNPIELDYPQRSSDEKLGYGDEITSQHLYQFMSPRLLLASASPRRLELLKKIVADNKIEVLISNQDEVYQKEDPIDRVKRLALEKARQILSRRGEFSSSIEIIIGADTEIVIDGKAVGRPKDKDEAEHILRKLSGRTHQAITGFALIDTRNGKEIVDYVSTEVEFKTLSKDEIKQYVQSSEPIGKAGAYGIQGKGALLIKKIDGSYSNIVGLPLERLSEILDREFGMPIWDIDKVSNWSFPHQWGSVR
jgi:septum formation protein